MASVDAAEPPEAVDQEEAPVDAMDTPSNGVPIMHGSDDFDAALASLSAPDPDAHEMFTTPDDRFHRHLSAMQANAPITTAGLRKTLENFAMPPTDEDSTLAEAIGATSGTTADLTVPPMVSVTTALSDIAQNAQTEHYQDNADPVDEPDSTLPQYSLSESNIEPSFVAALTAVNSSEPDLTEDSAESDMDSAAEIAARLTHLAMQSTAYATILTRAGALVASAGELSTRAVAGVVETIAQIWQTTDDDDAASDDSNTLPPRIRYIQVPGVGDFALYSIRTIAELYLSVLFPADTSLRLIRQQARRLIASLEQDSVGTTSGIVSSNDEPEAAKTLLSRPTEPLVPNGLREAIAAQGITTTAADRDGDAGYDTAVDNGRNENDGGDQRDHRDQFDQAVSAAPPPPTLVTIPDVPYSPYTLMWLPRTEALLMDIADQLPGWINTAASARAWKVSESTISAGCVSVRIDLPADQTPRGAIDTLQYATAERANEADLWSDGYYVIASERAVTPDEIASFVDYRRQTSAS
jgi:hypothetical protein